MLVPTTASIFLLAPAAGVLLVAVLIYLQISKRLIKKVPHPPLWPILGNAYLFMSLTPSEFLLKLKELNGTLGRRFQVALGPDVLLVTSEKKDLEEILSSPQLISKAREYDMLRNWLGDGLLLSTGRKWHSRRKVITPAFHFKILEQFVEVFDQQSDIFVKDVLSKFGANESVDVYPLVTLMALDVICGVCCYQRAAQSSKCF